MERCPSWKLNIYASSQLSKQTLLQSAGTATEAHQLVHPGPDVFDNRWWLAVCVCALLFSVQRRILPHMWREVLKRGSGYVARSLF